MKENVEFIQYCKPKSALKEVLVELTHYHYIQEFLRKLCQTTHKTVNIEKSYSKSKSLLDF